MSAIHKMSMVVILSLLAFCGVWAQEESSPAGQTAEVVIFRPKRFAGSALKPSIYIDNRQVARLGNGRFFSLQLPAGQHVFSAATTGAPRTHVEMQAGSKSYLEMVLLPTMGSAWGKVTWRLIPAAAEDAQEVLPKLKPLDAKWIVEKPEKDAK